LPFPFKRLLEREIVLEEGRVTTMSCGCQFWVDGETKETRSFVLRACPKGRQCWFVQFVLEESKKMGHGIAIAEKIRRAA
jgi:hypothetical protein